WRSLYTRPYAFHMPLFWLYDAWLPAVSVSIGMMSVPLAKLLTDAFPLLGEKTTTATQRASPRRKTRTGVRTRAKLVKPQIAIGNPCRPFGRPSLEGTVSSAVRRLRDLVELFESRAELGEALRAELSCPGVFHLGDGVADDVTGVDPARREEDA